MSATAVMEQPEASTSALIAQGSDGVLRPGVIQRRQAGAKDVVIDIEFAGMCHTDVHFLHGEMESIYPMVPGHEIFGRVTAVGAEVSKFQVGQRVGVGCLVDSCRSCATCSMHQEQYCKNMVLTYNTRLPNGDVTYGGYSTNIVVDEHFVCHIPEAIPDEKAAPLLCAGITVYSPLRRFGAFDKPGVRVGVLGLGGLGHLAVKVAKAAGCHVSVLSRTSGKADKARELGADDFVAYTEKESFEEHERSLDILLDTVASDHPVETFFSLLRPTGVAVAIGIFDRPVQMNVGAMLFGGFGYAGSLIGGMKETQEMLDFCAEKQIFPDVEVIPASKANFALANLADGNPPMNGGRYVIDVKNTFTAPTIQMEPVPFALQNKPVWFITGASAGFGSSFAEYALSQGYAVVATARNKDKLAHLEALDAENLLTVQLDVTKKADIQTAIDCAMQQFGRIDVLINNAGYGTVGAVEETPEDELRAQMETNFFGAVAMTQKVLPIMREQRSGAVVQISSMGGAMSFAGFGAYSASKFALEGMSEALQQEMAPFGVKVMIVEPGAFRTSFAKGGALRHMPEMEAYSEIVGGTRAFAKGMDGTQQGDPAKAAAAIDKALKSENTPLRLQLGEDAVTAVRQHAEKLLEDLKAWQAIALDTAVAEEVNGTA